MQYRKVKNHVLMSKMGLLNDGGYTVACAERAFLDIVFLCKDYYFDNLKILDWDKVFSLLPIYKSNVLTKRIKGHFKSIKNEI